MSSDNFGQGIISKVQVRKQAKTEIDNASQLLQGLSPSNPAEVLAKDIESDVTARELAGLLPSDEHKREAADKLLQATKHRPTILSRSLASVLIGAFLDTEVGSQVMDIVRLAGEHDEGILADAVKGAYIALHEGRNIDSACMLIAQALNESQIAPTPELVDTVISWLSVPIDPFPHIGARTRREYRKGPEEAFRALTSRDMKLVQDVVVSRLHSNEPYIRATACAAVQILLESVTDSITEKYFQPLLEALSMEDEEGYIDASICQTLAKMLAREPDTVSKDLFGAIEKAHEDLQKALFHVFIHDEAKEVVEVWIGPFINLLTTDNLADQTKFELSDLLSLVSGECPDVAFARLTSLFGILAIITNRLDSRRETSPSTNKMDISYLQYQADLSALGGTSRNLREVISHVAFVDIDKTLSEISRLIQSSDTNVAGSFKSELLLLLGDLGRWNAELAPSIVPIAFPHLLDPTSVVVRGAAAEAYGELVMRDRSCLPEDVIIALAALLGDQYLYPVKASVRAFEWIRVEETRLASEVVRRLILLYSAYREDLAQYDFLEKIAAALLNVGITHSSFLPLVAGIIRNLADHQYLYAAKDGLRLLGRLARGHREYQPLYLTVLLDYYSRFDLQITTRGSAFSSDRTDTEFEELYDLSPETMRDNSAKLLTTAQAQREPYNLIHFASLLVTVGLYEEAVQLFERYTALLPSEERYDWKRTHYKALALLLRVEVAVAENDLNKARQIIEQTLEELKAERKPERRLPFGLEEVIPKETQPDFHMLWAQVRKLWLNLSDDPAVTETGTEEVISTIQELKPRVDNQVDEITLLIHEELAWAAKFAAQWYQCVLNGGPEQDAKRQAIKARLWEALKISTANKQDLVEQRIKDLIGRVDLLSATTGIQDFLKELSLAPMPMPRQDLPVVRQWHRRYKQRIAEVEAEEEPVPSHPRIAFAKVWVDGQEAPQVINMIAERVYDMKIELELPDVDVEEKELDLIPMSTLPREEYLFPRQAVPMSKDQKKYDISGHIQFKHAQSEASQPIDIRIHAYLHRHDGTSEPCTVFGQSQLKFRVLDEDRLSALGTAEAKAVEKVLQHLEHLIPGMSPSSYKDEIEVITSIINYTGYQLAYPSFTRSETNEKDFQKDMSRHLHFHFKRTDVVREVQSGRGYLDVLVHGVPIELKVFKGQERMSDFVESSLPQATQYVVSQGRRVGLLCILDVSDRTTAAPRLTDDVTVCRGKTEEGIDPSPEGIVGVVVVIVRGALYPASKLRG